MLTFPSRVTQEHQVTNTRSTSPGDSYNSLKLSQGIISAKPNNLHYLFLKLRTIWLRGPSTTTKKLEAAAWILVLRGRHAVHRGTHHGSPTMYCLVCGTEPC